MTPDTIASADGTPIAVWRSGSGPSLVLVHGAIADHTRCRVVVMPGQRHAAMDTAPELFLGEVLAFLDAA